MAEKLTAQKVREFFDYNAEDGLLRWRKNPSRGPKRLGCVVGTVGTNGYRYINFWNPRVSRLAHRVVWLWVYGEWPQGEIDHINMNRDDNRLSNLRLATRAENRRNTRIRPDNTTGFKGVLAKGTGWGARIQAHGVVHYLGTFKTRELAYAAYCEAAKFVHGEFARGA